MKALAEHGYDTWYGPPSGFHGDKRSDFRFIVSQRMDKYDALADWRGLWAPGKKLIYEIDDDVFNVTVENWIAFRIYSDPVIQEAVRASAQAADLVTVTTEPLAEVMRQHNPNVAVIPNYVPDELVTWEPVWSDAVQAAREPGQVVIGWTGGASHAQDMAMVAPALRHVIDRHEQADVHIIGTDFRQTIGRPATFTNWFPSDASLRYYRLLRAFDIGIAPLTGTIFDSSKSSIKILEYWSQGIPVLASDCEPYRDLVKDGVNGYLIRRKGDWGKRLAELVNDADARREMGRNGREMVAASHTMSTGWRKWAQVFDALA